MTALRQLASVLGATLLIEEHDDLVAAVARVVRERGIHLHHGRRVRAPPRPRPPPEPLPQRLMGRPRPASTCG